MNRNQKDKYVIGNRICWLKDLEPVSPLLDRESVSLLQTCQRLPEFRLTRLQAASDTDSGMKFKYHCNERLLRTDLSSFEFSTNGFH